MKNVSAALVKAQRAFGPALKANTNPHFKSKYADLAACIEAVVDALNENGIALMQRLHPCESGVSVETLFVHESGEHMSAGVFSVPASKQDPQGYGSALTYARRYSLMAACGHAPEDDDGNAGSKAKADQKRAEPPAPDRTLVMKVSNAIIEHFAQDRELGALQEWQTAVDMSEEFAGAVWARLPTPERDKLRKLKDQSK